MYKSEGTGDRIRSEGIGDRVRSVRLAMGLSQYDLGAIVGVRQTQLCRIEKGKSLPSLETFYALVSALDVSADWLLMNQNGSEGLL